jgi:hypothetical protein
MAMGAMQDCCPAKRGFVDSDKRHGGSPTLIAILGFIAAFDAMAIEMQLPAFRDK